VTDLGPTVDDLLAALAHLPSRRRRLPLVVSVGRLHPAKGMARVVAAWRAALARSTNLIIIGGDLESPSEAERAELDAIARIATPRNGLVLLGRRSHEDVATILHLAAGTSSPPFPCGIYVAGSRKEEFGLAIVEAMACGLPVVAPAAGGPSTYVHDGLDGILVHDPTTSALANAMRGALELSHLPGRSAATAARLDGELTIERMAVRLRDVYVAVAAGAGVRS
jgi:glycosyltransferase involved in cell wall biosynthesis